MVPDQIEIGPYSYQVVMAENIVDGKGNGAYGRADYNKHIIYLDPNNTEDRMKVVLWHEIFHCILEAAGFSDDQMMGEEDLILRTSPWFAQVLMDNKELRDYYGG